MFDPPGFCDNLSQDLLDAWNDQIKETYYQVKNNFQRRQRNFGRFFRLKPSVSELVRVKKIIEWRAHPGFLESCLGSNKARLVCDMYSNKATYQAEYCEYRIIDRRDSNGVLRPKRVQVTTEFRDYWTCIAQHDPEKLKEMVKETIHLEADWNLLYGDDPYKLNKEERKNAFQRNVAGQGEGLDNWAKPLSVNINERNALCMIHPFNGLYDLLYSLMFGAVPYIINEPSLPREKHEIKNVKWIFLGVKDPIQDAGKNFRICAHADTSIVKRVYEQALYGRMMSLSNPIGLYIFSFNSDLFFLKDDPIPKEWMRWSRGQAETDKLPMMWQHFEFGPSDTDPWFLDDISIAVGNTTEQLCGGYQLLEQMEVGFMIDVEEDSSLKEEDYSPLNIKGEETICTNTDECKQMKGYWENIMKRIESGNNTRFK